MKLKWEVFEPPYVWGAEWMTANMTPVDRRLLAIDLSLAALRGEREVKRDEGAIELAPGTAWIEHSIRPGLTPQECVAFLEGIRSEITGVVGS